MKILFVCTGNICRSPLAQAVFEKLAAGRGLSTHYQTESAGTTAYHVGDNADERMRRTAAEHGVPFSHQSTQISRRDLDAYDLILVMDRDNLAAVERLARSGDVVGKVRMFREFDPHGHPGAPVPDPYYGGPDGFEEVFRIVDRTNRALLDALESGRTGAGRQSVPAPQTRSVFRDGGAGLPEEL